MSLADQLEAFALYQARTFIVTHRRPTLQDARERFPEATEEDIRAAHARAVAVIEAQISDALDTWNRELEAFGRGKRQAYPVPPAALMLPLSGNGGPEA